MVLSHYFKPLLHRLPPVFGREFIHRGMNTISSIPFVERIIEFLGHMEISPSLRKELFGVSFPSAVGLSGKIDPCLTGTKGLPTPRFRIYRSWTYYKGENHGNGPI